MKRMAQRQRQLQRRTCAKAVGGMRCYVALYGPVGYGTVVHRFVRLHGSVAVIERGLVPFIEKAQPARPPAS